MKPMLTICLTLAFRQTAAAQPEIETIRVNLSPAAIASPALRHRLMPPLDDLQPGNSALLYYRALAPELNGWRNQKPIQAAFDKWSDDMTKAPPAELAIVLKLPVCDELDLAARRAFCDWEMLPRIKKEGFNMLLPDVQAFRGHANVLAAKARFLMENKQYDEALRTLQTGFKLARDLDEGPTLIQDLVAIALVAIQLRQVEQFAQKPGSPNLYWALTDLPRPFVSCRKALQSEQMNFDHILPGARKMARDTLGRPLSPEELDAILAKAQNASQSLGAQTSFSNRFALGLIAARIYPKAKQALLDEGRPKEIVDKMPVAQVALIYEAMNYDAHYDDAVKWFNFPFPQGIRGLKEWDQRIKEAKSADGGIGSTMATLMVPALHKIFEARGRLQAKIDGLRCVEAIRAHVHKHRSFPKTLAEMKEVPIPDDPITGRPFLYVVDGNAATLSTETALGRHQRWQYVLTFDQTKK